MGDMEQLELLSDVDEIAFENIRIIFDDSLAESECSSVLVYLKTIDDTLYVEDFLRWLYNRGLGYHIEFECVEHFSVLKNIKGYCSFKLLQRRQKVWRRRQ